MESLVTLDEVKLWLRIDGNEDDALLNLLIGGAEQYLLDATGRTWPPDNHTAKICALAIIADNFENREVTSNDKLSVRPAIQSMINQLSFTPEPEEVV